MGTRERGGEGRMRRKKRREMRTWIREDGDEGREMEGKDG